MLAPDHIAEAFAQAGSIRGAASLLGFDERTLRRWAQEDERVRRVLYPKQSGGTSLSTAEDNSMKILALDIETRPNVALVWDLWQRGVPMAGVTEPTKMLCWAAKWIGDDVMYYAAAPPAPGREGQYAEDERSMVAGIWSLMNQADAVVHYNGAKFDIPYLNMEFVRHGLGPPSPYKQIDLYKIVKKQFAFPSKKLAYVSREFGLEGKVEHEGFPLWIKCMNGDPEAWERMREYNQRDTALLEDMYLKLRAWGTSLPSYGAFVSSDVCPACGSDNLKRQGFEYTRTGKYQRYQCGSCGKWSRATKRTSGTGVTEV